MSHSIKPKVAVLIAVYNGFSWLEEQLNSILSQEGVEVSLFINIDPSIDASEALCRQFSMQHKNITILPSVGKFGSAAQNFFRLLRDVDFSDFDYISFADQDDIWFKNKLISAANQLLTTHSDGYSSDVVALWSCGKQKLIKKSQPQCKWDYMFESAGPGCTFVITKKIALDLQKILIAKKDECATVISHDWFIYAFVRSLGYSWYIDKQPYMLYRQHGNNVMGANVGVIAILKRIIKFRDGWFTRQVINHAVILDYANSWPIQKITSYTIYARLCLIFKIYEIRRRLRDRVALVCFLIFITRKPGLK